MIHPHSKYPFPSPHSCGGKGYALFRLKEANARVPEFVVIDAELKENEIREDLAEKILVHFPDHEKKYFAVRSSAVGEDGNSDSFAGQFETFLNVRSVDLIDKIREVKSSVHSGRVKKYAEGKKIKAPEHMAVIVQVMIDPEVAGVGFGINPVTGTRTEKVISAVYGLGEGLVSGELNSDTWIVDENKITSTIVTKEKGLFRNKNGGNEWRNIPAEKAKVPSLNDNQIKEIAVTIEKLNRSFGIPQDVEFAWQENELFLLQSRPITTLAHLADKTQQYIVWDNSNIIESYPGVTTPLTFSFIIRSYEGAYRLFLGYLGADNKTIDDHAEVFANTLGLINGRVYYNLRSWYRMLAMVPGYSINAGFMEKMMGVKEKFELPDQYKLSKSAAWWRTIRMLIKMIRRYRSITRTRNEFKVLLDKTIIEYRSLDYHKYSINELHDLYIKFEKKLLNEWKAPLLNDFFAMIAFGRFQKLCEKYGLNRNNPNIHNDLLCGSNDIISTQPIHRAIEIASVIYKNVKWKAAILGNDERTFLHLLDNSEFSELKNLISNYISDFGDRCVGELKLETISYTHEPVLFIRVLRSYVEGKIISVNENNQEEIIRSSAEKEACSILGNNIFRKRKFRKSMSKARELVSNRENLRYERTRAFGIVRELFIHIGKRFYSEGILENERDIFYLTREEIFAWISGTSVTQNLKELVRIRKNEFEYFKSLPVPSERIATYGPVYHGNNFYSLEKIELIEGDLKGIGCCPGRIRKKIRIVLDPTEIHDVKGDILVTTSTDPGWVTLFPTCSGLIVERGSLLSHSAIVAREMGIPCIVGVSGLLRNLEDGEEVEMDGSTGVIKRFK